MVPAISIALLGILAAVLVSQGTSWSNSVKQSSKTDESFDSDADTSIEFQNVKYYTALALEQLQNGDIRAAKSTIRLAEDAAGISKSEKLKQAVKKVKSFIYSTQYQFER